MALASHHFSEVSLREKWRTRVGLSESECRVLCCVLAGYWYHLRPITSSEIRARLTEWEGVPGAGDAVGSVATRGWIREVGRVNNTRHFVPTDRGYAILGLEPFDLKKELMT